MVLGRFFLFDGDMEWGGGGMRVCRVEAMGLWRSASSVTGELGRARVRSSGTRFK